MLVTKVSLNTAYRVIDRGHPEKERYAEGSNEKESGNQAPNLTRKHVLPVQNQGVRTYDLIRHAERQEKGDDKVVSGDRRNFLKSSFDIVHLSLRVS